MSAIVNRDSLLPKRERHPNSLANLRPFRLGNPGGPGRPKYDPLTKRLKLLAKKKLEAERFARAQFDTAQDPQNPRSVSAAQLILDRVEGPIVQRTETASVSLSISVSEQQSAEETLLLLQRATQEG